MYSILQLMMAVLNWNISLNEKKIVCFLLQFIQKDIHCEGEIWLTYSQKLNTSQSSILLFFTKKLNTVIFIDGGQALSRFQNDKTKTSNIWELVFVTTTLVLKLVVEWRRLSSFPAKMTLVHARALLSGEKISYS